VTAIYVPALTADHLALWLDDGGNAAYAPIVAWRVEDGQVIEGVALGGSSPVVWLPEGKGVVDLSTGHHWVSEVEWREDPSAGAEPVPTPVEAALSPRLSAEYRVRLRLPSGFTIMHECSDLAEAEARAARTTAPKARAVVERRLVAPWEPSEPRRAPLGRLEALRASEPVPEGSNGASGA
jgi:hypothetical protein